VTFRNEELPRDFRLQDDLFQMTTFTYNDIRAKTEEKLNLVRSLARVNFTNLQGSISSTFHPQLLPQQSCAIKVQT
jgi:hypothetical protein